MKIKIINSVLESKVCKEAIVLSAIFVTTFSITLGYIGIINNGLDRFHAQALADNVSGLKTGLSAEDIQELPQPVGEFGNVRQSYQSAETGRKKLPEITASDFTISDQEQDVNSQAASDSDADLLSSSSGLLPVADEASLSLPSVPTTRTATVNSGNSASRAALNQTSLVSYNAASALGNEASSNAIESNLAPQQARQTQQTASVEIAVSTDPSSPNVDSFSDATELAAETNNQTKPTLNVLEQKTFYDDPVVCPPLTNFREEWREGAAAIQRQYGCVL